VKRLDKLIMFCVLAVAVAVIGFGALSLDDNSYRDKVDHLHHTSQQLRAERTGTAAPPASRAWYERRPTVAVTLLCAIVFGIGTALIITAKSPPKPDDPIIDARWSTTRRL
jgi:hypothetical protein